VHLTKIIMLDDKQQHYNLHTSDTTKDYSNDDSWIAYAKNTSRIDYNKFSLLGYGWKYFERIRFQCKPMKCIIKSPISCPILKRCTPTFQRQQHPFHHDQHIQSSLLATTPKFPIMYASGGFFCMTGYNSRKVMG
jgi:hypothetical protein